MRGLHVIVPALAFVALAFVAVLVTRDDGAPRLHATFVAAPGLVKGAPVKIAGVDAGKVAAIGLRGNQADVTLQLDDRFWPLRDGTRATIRWGGSLSYANRYVELQPGPAKERALGDGERLATRDTLTPVEFSELFNLFDEPAREDLARFIDRTDATFGPTGDALARGLDEAAPAADEGAQVLARLGADPAALRTLVDSGADVAGALAAREPELRAVVDGYAATSDEIAAHAATVRATLAQAPPTLHAMRTTLQRTGPTLDRARRVLVALRPGVRAARRLAPRASDALVALADVAPRLDRTLVALRSGAPRIGRLLRTARVFLSEARPVVTRLTPMLDCIRPYTPDLVAFMQHWGQLINFETPDGKGVARVTLNQYPFGNSSDRSVTELQKEYPNLGYATIPPPGYFADKPQFRPECGITPEGLDATKDWWRRPPP